jgi:hypothetical protein
MEQEDGILQMKQYCSLVDEKGKPFERMGHKAKGPSSPQGFQGSQLPLQKLKFLITEALRLFFE